MTAIPPETRILPVFQHGITRPRICLSTDHTVLSTCFPVPCPLCCCNVKNIHAPRAMLHATAREYVTLLAMRHAPCHAPLAMHRAPCALRHAPCRLGHAQCHSKKANREYRTLLAMCHAPCAIPSATRHAPCAIPHVASMRHAPALKASSRGAVCPLAPTFSIKASAKAATVATRCASSFANAPMS